MTPEAYKEWENERQQRHEARKYVAVIAPTVAEAERLAKSMNIPTRNAISGSDHSLKRGRGRTFAGYILLPGYLPAPAFWENFNPTLIH